MPLKSIIMSAVLSTALCLCAARAATETKSAYREAVEAAQALGRAGKLADARVQYEAALAAAATGTERADVLLAVAATYVAERKPAAARAEYEKALAVAGIAPGQAGEALLGLSDISVGEARLPQARETLEKALALKDAPEPLKARAHMALGGVFEGYANWPQVKAEYGEALKSPSLAPVQRTRARKALVNAHLKLREFAAARAAMRDLISAQGVLPDPERAAMQVALARTLMTERNYPEARAELLKAQAMPGLETALRPEVQLLVALTCYEAGDYERAAPELKKVLTMKWADLRPQYGADPADRVDNIPAREALLRLRLRNLTPADGQTLKVLFIGTSHTLRHDVPGLVMQSAASAPADKPRIIAGDYIRMGASIVNYWVDGDGPDTVRALIAAEPWDAVVFETYHTMSSADIAKYSALFADLIRSRKAKPVAYETLIPRLSQYPERFQHFHGDNAALVKSAGVSVAPGLRAGMLFLGPQPSPGRFAALYSDWLQPTPAGSYMMACCIYAALTGASPVGLWHPADIAEADARTLQELAWQADRETNAAQQN